MGCFYHNQEYIGTCMWCGKQLCSRCVARAVGKKLYCHNCASNLGDIEIRHDNPEPIERAPVQQQPKHQTFQTKAQVKPTVNAPTIASLADERLRKSQSMGSQPKAASSASAPSAQPKAPSPVSSPAASSAAKSALGMFAQQAMEQIEAEKKKKEVK